MFMLITASILTLAGGDAKETSPNAQAMPCALKAIHWAAGPGPSVGYRMGDRAMRELGLPRQSFNLLVVHHAPAEVQYSCVADGLQAATGASPGKLNLKLVEASVEQLTPRSRTEKPGGGDVHDQARVSENDSQPAPRAT